MSNRDIEAARFFHEATKHSYTSVRSSPHLLDWDNRPIPYKIYPDAPPVMLPRDLNLASMPALEAMASGVAPSADEKLDLEALTRILFCADGLTRRRQVGDEEYHFRAAASAGALYPIEIYVAASAVEGLAPGLYHFSPADLKLRALRPGDFRSHIANAAAGRASLSEARAILILTSIFWRSAWKYRARAYRYCFWDAGTVLANLLAAATGDRLSADLVTAFVDAEIEALLGMDTIHEGVAALVAIGSTVQAGLSADASDARQPIGYEAMPLSAEEVIYPDLVQIQQESRLLSPAEVNEISAAGELLGNTGASAGEATPGRGLGDAILRRGATREFSHNPIPGDDLRRILAASSNHPQCDFPPLCDIYLIANAVEGIEAGAYFYDRTGKRLELLKAGDFRGNAGYLCLEQPLGADCSALICYMARLDSVLELLGNRGYRDVHLEAGILGGRAWLASFALGHGATGSTFYDDDSAKFFSPHADGKSPILMVALGDRVRND